MQIILVLAVMFGIYLIFVLGYLAYLNWSYKVQASLLSISLVGIGTLLVTIFSGLKDQKISTKIISTVFVEAKALNFAGFPEQNNKFYSRSMVLKTLGDMAGRNPALDYSIDSAWLPSKDDDWFIFNEEAFIYDIFRYISVSSEVGDVFDLDPSKKTFGIHGIDLPLRTEKININQIKTDFKWFNGYYLDSLHAKMHINVPQGTHISFYRESQSDQRSKMVLEFAKNRYFKITFALSRITAPSIEHTQKFTSSGLKTEVRSCNYLLEMDAVFDKYSSSGDRSASYVNWSNSVFQVVKDKYDDRD